MWVAVQMEACLTGQWLCSEDGSAMAWYTLSVDVGWVDSYGHYFFAEDLPANPQNWIPAIVA